MKKLVLLGIIGTMLVSFTACGIVNTGKENTESTQRTEETQETESEFYIEITDAAEILTKTWELYAEEERFVIMGGHFESAVMDMPAKFDLTQTTDLVQMYCVPESQVGAINDAATMIDLYNAGRFTAAAFHVTEAENTRDFVAGVKAQVRENQWHGETPEKHLVVVIDEQYVVSVYGRESLVNQFKQNLESIYQEMVKVMVEEKNS